MKNAEVFQNLGVIVTFKQKNLEFPQFFWVFFAFWEIASKSTV